MKAKKTIQIEELKSFVNKMLAIPVSENITTEYKSGMANLLEHFLLENNAYKGYYPLKSVDFDSPEYYDRKYF